MRSASTLEKMTTRLKIPMCMGRVLKMMKKCRVRPSPFELGLAGEGMETTTTTTKRGV
jgi:hypothetical protein